MYFRREHRWKTEVLTEGTTFNEALPDSGVLDCILATIRIYNNAAMYDVVKNNIWDHITAVKLAADGVEAPYDAHGMSCLAAYGVEYGACPPGFLDTMSSNYQSLTFPIMLGRRLFDGDYGFDLSKPGETRLQITNDFAVGDIQATKNIWLDVDLIWLEGKHAPAKYVGLNQISQHTWTANSQEYTYKVPKKYPVRRILLTCVDFRSGATSAQTNKAWRNIRYLTYTYKSGTLKVLDNLDLYRHDQDALWGFPDMVEVVKNEEPRTGYTFDTGLARTYAVVAVPSYSADPGSDTELTIDQRMERFLSWRRADSGFQGRIYAKGYGFMDTICLHEDKPDNEVGWLDPSAQADVEVKIGNSSSGGSSGNTRFVTQNLRLNA